jgi:hypothetical protein
MALIPWLTRGLVPAFVMLSTAGLAHAGGVGGTGTGTGTGGSSGDSSTGAGSTGDSGDSGSSGSTGGCETDGLCTDPPGDSVTIESPLDGATVLSPVSVTISSTFACSCIGDCCWEDDPASVSLIVDGPTQLPCEGGMCTLSVDLEPGEHVLRAIGQYATGTQSSPQITITVEAVGGSTTSGGDDTGPVVPSTTSGPATTGTETDTAGSNTDSSGCSCTTGGDLPATPWGGQWAWLLPLAAVGRRRPRRRGR